MNLHHRLDDRTDTARASADARLSASSRGRVTSACIASTRAISVGRALSAVHVRPRPVQLGIGGLSLAPKGRGAVQSTQPFAKLSLSLREPLLVPFEHASARAGDSAAAGCRLDSSSRQIMRDMQVVGISKIVLQALQSLHESCSSFWSNRLPRSSIV